MHRKRKYHELGIFLKAARHGFFWSSRRNIYVRFSRNPKGGFLVEVASKEAIEPYIWPLGHDFILWKELAQEGESLLVQVEPIRQGGLPSYKRFVVDNEGKLVA